MKKARGAQFERGHCAFEVSSQEFDIHNQVSCCILIFNDEIFRASLTTETSGANQNHFGCLDSFVQHTNGIQN